MFNMCQYVIFNMENTHAVPVPQVVIRVADLTLSTNSTGYCFFLGEYIAVQKSI